MHKKQLDGLRFFSFLGVFLYHTNLNRFWFGSYAVPLFFVLSGFLITRILLEGKGPLKEVLLSFYARRFLRIFPVYYLLLLVLLVLRKIQFPVWNIFYLFNVKLFLLSLDPHRLVPVLEHWRSAGIHFWSLCVEEQFYLIYPLILLAVPAARRLAVLFGLLFTSILCRLIFKIYLGSSYYGVLLPVCGEYLLWGCLSAYVEKQGIAKHFSPPAILYGGLFFLTLLFLWGQPPIPAWTLSFHPPYRQTLLGIGFSLLILGLWEADHSWPAKLLAFRPLAYLGKISYGLYLFHPFAWEFRDRFVKIVPELAGIPQSLFRLALTVIAAALSWHFFESPINRLRKRFSFATGTDASPIQDCKKRA